MKTKKFKIQAELEDNTIVSIDLPPTEVVIQPSQPAPNPIPTPEPVPNPVPTPPVTSKYGMLNCITWGVNPLANLPNEATEYTYFVLPVSKSGALLGVNGVMLSKFINDVHAKGKKATISIAGGAQNVSDITAAVTSARAAFLTNISNLVNTYGADGVTIDIENTSISPDVIVSFFKDLRAKLGPDKIIGTYTQPYQLNTVWSKFEQAAHTINWLSAMIYDYPNTVAEAKQQTLAWLPKVGGDRKKLLFGAAVNYSLSDPNAGGMDLNEWAQILDWVNQEGLGGVGIWQDQIYTQPYRDLYKTKFGV